MTLATRLGLGTAQFGSDYGITNRHGRVEPAEAVRILKLAQTSRVEVIDTARLYGDSEATIGLALAPEYQPRIVTKTPKFDASSSSEAAVEQLRDAFALSERQLGRQPAGLLIHDSTDLLGSHGEALWSAMEDLKAAGRIDLIGLSAYSGAEIDTALDRFPVDLVQLPWNPLDHRLVAGGQLERLKAAGVEVHARSLFLQGLLLQPSSEIPIRFKGLGEAIEELDMACKAVNLTRLEGLIALASGQASIDVLICGVSRTEDLQAIALAEKMAQTADERFLFKPAHDLDPRILNPARWDELR